MSLGMLGSCGCGCSSGGCHDRVVTSVARIAGEWLWEAEYNGVWGSDSEDALKAGYVFREVDARFPIPGYYGGGAGSFIPRVERSTTYLRKDRTLNWSSRNVHIQSNTEVGTTTGSRVEYWVWDKDTGLNVGFGFAESDSEGYSAGYTWVLNDDGTTTETGDAGAVWPYMDTLRPDWGNAVTAGATAAWTATVTDGRKVVASGTGDAEDVFGFKHYYTVGCTVERSQAYTLSAQTQTASELLDWVSLQYAGGVTYHAAPDPEAWWRCDLEEMEWTAPVSGTVRSSWLVYWTGPFQGDAPRGLEPLPKHRCIQPAYGATGYGAEWVPLVHGPPTDWTPVGHDYWVRAEKYGKFQCPEEFTEAREQLLCTLRVDLLAHRRDNWDNEISTWRVEGFVRAGEHVALTPLSAVVSDANGIEVRRLDVPLWWELSILELDYVLLQPGQEGLTADSQYQAADADDATVDWQAPPAL